MTLYYVLLHLVQSGLQALHFAAKSGNVEIAEELLKRGASVNATSLVCMLCYGCFTAINYLSILCHATRHVKTSKF